MRLDAGQRDALLRLMEAQTPWGDIEAALESFEMSLRHALEATRADFCCWEEHVESAGYDEFSIDPWQIDAMSPEWKLALVARLLRSAALHYGLGTEFGGELGLPTRTSRDALAPLLHDLVEVTSHSTREQPLRDAVERLDRTLRAADRDPEHRGWYLAKAEAQARSIIGLIQQLVEAEADLA